MLRPALIEAPAATRPLRASRLPPPVQALETVDGPWAVAQALWLGAAAAVLCLWAFQSLLALAPGSNWPWLAAVGSGIAAAALAWGCRRREARLLHWDGEVWRLQGQAGQARMAWDLSAALWLRFEPSAGGRAQRLLLSKGSAQTSWALFRTVLLAPGAGRSRKSVAP